MCQGGRLFGPFEPFRCRLDTESFSYALPVVKVAEIGSLAKYTYLANGSKSEAENGSGVGLVYRGSLIYRKAAGGETFRERFTGKEDQSPDFGTACTDVTVLLLLPRCFLKIQR